MDIRTALAQGRELLEKESVPAARLTAEVLLCHALACERSHLYGYPEQELNSTQQLHYGRYLYERLAGKPTQHITHRQEFYGREFRVTPDVLIPRPETEHVVETAIEVAGSARTILDVGCGSGAIAVTLSLELRRAVFASDLSIPALQVARRNAECLGANVAFFAGDATAAVASASLDLLVSNPPYIPRTEEAGLPREVREHEPGLALFGGPEGLDMYRRLTADASRILRPGGWLIFEIGFRQAERVRGMLDAGWSEIRIVPDLAGFDRVLAAQKSWEDPPAGPL